MSADNSNGTSPSCRLANDQRWIGSRHCYLAGVSRLDASVRLDGQVDGDHEVKGDVKELSLSGASISMILFISCALISLQYITERPGGPGGYPPEHLNFSGGAAQQCRERNGEGRIGLKMKIVFLSSFYPYISLKVSVRLQLEISRCMHLFYTYSHLSFSASLGTAAGLNMLWGQKGESTTADLPQCHYGASETCAPPQCISSFVKEI